MFSKLVRNREWIMGLALDNHYNYENVVCKIKDQIH